MDTSKIKISVFGGVAVITGILLGFFFSKALSGGNLLLPMILAVVFLSLLSIQLLFIENKKLLALIVLAESLSAFALMPYKFSGYLLIALALFCALMVRSSSLGQASAQESLKTNPNSPARVFLPGAITAFALITSFIYVTTFIGFEFNLTRDATRSLLAPLEYTTKTLIPDFSLDMKITGLLQSVIAFNPPGDLGTLTKDQLAQLVRESEGPLLEAISGALKVSVSRNDSVLDVLHRAALAQIVRIPADLKTPILFALGFLVFLTVRGLGYIVKYLSLGLTFILYKILLSAGFFRITTSSVEKQVLVI